jgi:threonine dehydrogenase-like Zn-dependent dehydrogenase
MMHIALARLSGAIKIMVSEVVDERAAQAERFGADLVLNSGKEDLISRIAEETNGEGTDVVIVAAPSPEAQEQSLQVAARGGRINFFGGLPAGKDQIRFRSNLVHYKELVVKGTTGSSTYEYRQAMNILASGRVDLSPLISERFKLEDVLHAFQLATSRKAFKVIITPC